MLKAKFCEEAQGFLLAKHANMYARHINNIVISQNVKYFNWLWCGKHLVHFEHIGLVTIKTK